MSTTTTISQLDNDFLRPRHGAEEWKKSVETILKGKEFSSIEKDCVFDGEKAIIKRQPLYTNSDLNDLPTDIDSDTRAQLFDKQGSDCRVCAEYSITGEDLDRLPPMVVHEVQYLGVDDLHFKIDSNIPFATLDTFFQSLLTKLKSAAPQKTLQFSFDLGDNFWPWAQHFSPLFLKEQIGVRFNADRLTKEMGDLTLFVNANFPANKARSILVNTKPYHQAGASVVQELTCALSTAILYIRHILGQTTKTSLSLAEITERFSIAIATESDIFLTIAKIRAIRFLWVRMAAATFDTPIKNTPWIHAYTAQREYSKVEMENNILRGGAGAFAGILGGANSITVHPFDIPDNADQHAHNITTARHLSLTTSLVLREEAKLGQVTDPAAGSYYLEKLTSDLIETVWTSLQDLEAQGGIAKSDLVNNKIDEHWNHLRQRLKSGQQVMVGVNQFRISPMPEELNPQASNRAPFALRRLSEDFE